MPADWQKFYARRSRGIVSSAIREILKVTQQPDVISFAGGLPAPEAFPVEQVKAAACRVLDASGAQALQYSTTEGYLPLRQFIVQKMARHGVVIDEDNILLTTGSQQALSLIGTVLINARDLVVCEAPSYLGALQAFGTFQSHFATVPIDDDGMQVDRVKAILKKHPVKFIYALPNFQNPGGTTLGLERREQLVALANQYAIPLIEDDPYGELRFEGEHLPCLFRLDQMRQHTGGQVDAEHGHVIYLSTFSKTLAPGLRLGWIIAPKQVIRKLVQAKQSADLHSSTFDQMLAYEVVRMDGFHDDHIRKIQAMYKERRDVMLAAMEKYFPPGVQWTRPQGGLFLWVTLPDGLDAQALFPKAVEHKVAFVPGDSFYAPHDISDRPLRRKGTLPRGHNTMRLNFSNSCPEKIEQGIRALGHVIATAMEEM